MKQIQALIYTILILLILSANAAAGDYADLKFIGFSEDGKYLAFEESGEWDVHRGGDYATTYFIDVEKNVYAAAPSVFDFSENDDSHTGKFSRAARLIRYRKSVVAQMKRFKIVAGNVGKLVVAHLSSDHSFEKPVYRESYILENDGTATKKIAPFYEGGQLSPGDNSSKVIFNPFSNPVNPADDEFYELTLDVTGSKEPCYSDGNSLEHASKIKLTLQDNTHHTDLEPQILQKDERLPESRRCADSYAIEQVYFYKDNLAVFLNYEYSYPNRNRRYMAVTGKLDYASNR